MKEIIIIPLHKHSSKQNIYNNILNNRIIIVNKQVTILLFSTNTVVTQNIYNNDLNTKINDVK